MVKSVDVEPLVQKVDCKVTCKCEVTFSTMHWRGTPNLALFKDQLYIKEEEQCSLGNAPR